MRATLCGLAAAGLFGAMVANAGGAAASEAGHVALSGAQTHAYPGESYTQYRRFYRGGGRRYGGYYGRGYRGRGYGVGVGAGIAGLAAGALIGGAIASQAAPAPVYGGPGTPVGNVYGQDPNAVNYCASRYRSYDPQSGTFLANDGNRYACP